MNETTASQEVSDEFGCVGNFNPRDSFCYRKCALSLRCIIECNRQARLEKYMDILELENIGPVDLQ